MDYSSKYFRETERRQLGRRLTREDISLMCRKILEDCGLAPQQGAA